MELAIDTSNEVAGLALSREGVVLAELTWVVGRNHTQETIPALLRLLEQAGAGLGEVRGVIVARGPGSFSGVRVGISLAKGLALALNIPLVGVSTLEAMALALARLGLPICPLLKFGRELAVAIFQLQGGKFVKLAEEQVADPARLISLASKVEGPIVFCGDIGPEVSNKIRLEMGGRALFLSSRLHRPGYLCELGWQRLKAGDWDDLATLQPLYLKKPSITLKRK